MTTRDQIITAARTQLKTRFVHQGRMPNVALDCAGLLIVTANLVGYFPEDDVTYGRAPDAAKLRALLDRQLVCDAPLLKGNVGLFWVADESRPVHLGIFTGPNSMVHALAQERRVVENSLDPYWLDRLVTCYALPGVED